MLSSVQDVSLIFSARDCSHLHMYKIMLLHAHIITYLATAMIVGSNVPLLRMPVLHIIHYIRCTYAFPFIRRCIMVTKISYELLLLVSFKFTSPNSERSESKYTGLLSCVVVSESEEHSL